MTCEHMDSCRGWLFCFRLADELKPKYLGIIECHKETWCYKEEDV